MLMCPKISADVALCRPVDDVCKGTTALRRVNTKQRVREEMRKRASIMKPIRPNLQSVLNHSFAELRAALACHVCALGNSVLTLFANSSLDEALAALDLGDGQHGVLE